jgi:hypothetical protein
MVRAQAPQGSNQMEDVILDHQGLHLAPDGRHRTMKMNETGSAMAMKYGEEVPGHAMFYRQDGKNYVVRDRKMADGSTLFQRAGDWESRS